MARPRPRPGTYGLARRPGSGVTPGRQLSEARHKRLVLVVTGLLRRGDPPTPFAREGMLIAAVRLGDRVVRRRKWRDADQAAREVVREALRALGAKRPTWVEASTPHYAQADAFSLYERTRLPNVRLAASARERALLHHAVPQPLSRCTVARGTGRMGRYGRRGLVRLEDLPGPTCPQCGAEVPAGKRIDAIFCSRRCASASYDAAERKALLEVRMQRPPCPHCGGKVPLVRIATAVYCSPACALTASNAIARYLRTCEHCKRDFRAKNPRQRFCSTHCRDNAVVRKHHPRACLWCGAVYQPRRADGKYCSIRCAARHREAARAGARSGSMLSRP